MLNVETGSQGLVILSYATVCLHPCVSLNNEKNCRIISEHEIAVCEKTAGLWTGIWISDLDSACLKVLVPVKIFQFEGMHNETERYRDTTDRLYLMTIYPLPVSYYRVSRLSRYNKQLTYRKITVVCKQLNSQSSILVPSSGRHSDKSCFEWSLEIICYNTATVVVTNEHLTK